jgi:hypothetical protein
MENAEKIVCHLRKTFAVLTRVQIPVRVDISREGTSEARESQLNLGYQPQHSSLVANTTTPEGVMREKT